MENSNNNRNMRYNQEIKKENDTSLFRFNKNIKYIQKRTSQLGLSFSKLPSEEFCVRFGPLKDKYTTFISKYCYSTLPLALHKEIPNEKNPILNLEV